MINFNKEKLNFHFIGIGGISMSGLAELLLSMGHRVTGSDGKASALTKRLEQLGAKVFIGQAAENVNPSSGIVVMTAAIRENNPELMQARALGLTVLTRAELLGEIMALYDTSLAVSGTHGKTTTTSMISEILLRAKLNPTLSIGGILPSINGNFRVGGSKYFVTEACEYTNSFLSFKPLVEIILNIDADHLDFFKDIDDIRSSFKKFATLLPDAGILIINGDIDNVSEIYDGCKARVITFGLSEKNEYSACDITFDEFARPTFTLLEKGTPAGQFTLGVTGIHNVSNALSAICFARLFDIPVDVIKDALLSFTGTDRRFQKKGVLDGVTIIDDYAHHPTEIAATLSTAKNYPHKTLWCVFQPHTYTRTKALFEDFAKALCGCDRVLLADIYAARETDTLGISSALLADRINELGGNAEYLPTFDEIKKKIKKNCIHGDVLITMGAGDVVNIGDELLGL